MKSFRVVLVVLGLLALPLVAAAAQGQSAANKCKNTPQAGQNGNSQRGAAAVAQAQANKCPAPVTLPPPSDAPPTGPHKAMGIVFEDINGGGSRELFDGEMGL